MKVTSATIRLVLKKSKTNKNGESPIHLVICYHGRAEKSTGISVKPKDWDEKRECVKKSAGNAPVLNKMLNDFKNEIIERRAAFEMQGRQYTTRMLFEDSRPNKTPNNGTFLNVYQRLIEERRLKDGTVRGYTYTYRKLCEYLRRKEFFVDELVLGIVKDFASWLEKEGIKINTIKKVLGCIAAVWNYAIQRKIVTGENYPFLEFKYTLKYKEVPRDYYLEKSHIARLKEYWLDLIIERNGNRWHYKDGALDKLHNRCSKEFGILWFLLCYKYGGAAPVDVALLRPSNFKMESLNGEDYWKLEFRRRKTGRSVSYMIKRDIFSIISIEHFLGLSGHFVYPVMYWSDGCSDRYLLEQSHKTSDKAIKWVRKAFLEINGKIAQENVDNSSNEPVVDVERVVMYTARHSRASNYFNSPGATIGKLATMLGRSAATIGTYAHMIKKKDELAELDDNCVI